MAEGTIAREIKRNKLTAGRLREALDYNPETGLFTRKSKQDAQGRWNSRWAGKVAGCISQPSGYRVIGIDGVLHSAGRLAWFYVTGEWPDEIDHINGNRSDDRFTNLREVTHAQNMLNLGSNRKNTSGHKGIYWKKDKKRWLVQISLGGKQRIIGYFHTIEVALAARKEAYAKLHGDFVRLD